MSKVKRPTYQRKKRSRKLPLFFKLLFFTLIILTTIILVALFKLNILPNKYIIPLTFILIGIDLILLILFKIRGKARVTGTILSFLFIVLYSVSIAYLGHTNNFFKNINKGDLTKETYNVIVRSDSKYQDIKELKNAKIGFLNNDEDNYKKAKDSLNKLIKYEEIKEEDTYKLASTLINNDTEAFVLDQSQVNILQENYKEFKNKTRVLYSFTIEIKQESITKEIDATKENFILYISGIDTYGSINNVGRSDVNIIAAVNPQEGKISLVAIPRDYYVQMYKKNGLKDKLTHTGIHGMETQVKTIENLLGIEINYYIKFNFTSVIKIIDTIGPITVYSDTAFSSGVYDEKMTEANIYHYQKGYNTLDGWKTLSYARERYNLNGGDLARGKHQEDVIEAVIKKICSPAILSKYNKLMDTLGTTFITDLSDENMTKFIKKELDKPTDWQIEKYVMNGDSSLEYTYSYPSQKLYVMLPNEQSMTEAKELINKTLNK